MWSEYHNVCIKDELMQQDNHFEIESSNLNNIQKTSFYKTIVKKNPQW